MLGTNDLKVRFHATAEDFAYGAGVLVQMIMTSKTGKHGLSSQVLLLAPPPIIHADSSAEMFANGVDKSRNFGKYFARIAEEQKCNFLDAGEVIRSHPNDGIHFDDVAHKKIGLAISAVISEILK